MHVLFPEPERMFKIERRGGLALFTPLRRKAGRSDWTEEELPYRSLVVREDSGEVVSAGFPKFFNHKESGESGQKLSPEGRQLLGALKENRPVWFTEKMDGSLCIRSVIDGQVVFRTRGTLQDTEHTRAMREVATHKYPILLDPTFEPERSLLFEFVSPLFRIIIRYQEADLIFIGIVSHHDLSLADVPELKQVAEESGFHLVQIMELPTDFSRLEETVEHFASEEGVVARTDNGQTLVKMKSARYLAFHRLRFALSAKRLQEICKERNVHSPDDFAEYLKEHDADWELVEDVRPLVDTYLEAQALAEARFAVFKDEVPKQLADAGSRRDFAVSYAVPLGGVATHVAFALADEREQDAYDMVLDEELGRAFAEAEAADEERLAAIED